MMPLPRFIQPMAARSVTKLPGGPDWLYEVKFDGHRALLMRAGGRVELRSRNDKDLTKTCPIIAAAGLKLPAESLTLDGELVALDAAGRPSFQALQHRSAHPNHAIVYYAFDLLHLDGKDFTSLPLTGRRATLTTLVRGSDILLSEPLEVRSRT